MPLPLTNSSAVNHHLLTFSLFSTFTLPYTSRPATQPNITTPFLLNSWPSLTPPTAGTLTSPVTDINFLQEKAQKLNLASEPLQRSHQANVYLERTTTSSNPNAITAQASRGATPATYTIAVSQLATTQENRGSTLNLNAPSDLPAGLHKFSLQAGGKTYNLYLDVRTGDTNLTLLNNMARVINASGAPVSARVDIDSASSTGRLVIRAAGTGTDNAFLLSDVTGSAVAYTGAGSVTTPAVNAVYNVNGREYTAPSNTVTLDNGNLTLNFKASTTATTITAAPNTEIISQAIDHFVTAYNDLLTQAVKRGTPFVPWLAANLKQAYKNQAAALSSIGIERKPDGTLTVNQEKLTAALQQNPSLVENVLGGSKGLATITGRTAKHVTTLPLPAVVGSLSPPYNQQGLLNAFNFLPVILPPGSLFSQLT